jgi:hypothetical protein
MEGMMVDGGHGEDHGLNGRMFSPNHPSDPLASIIHLPFRCQRLHAAVLVRDVRTAKMLRARGLETPSLA